MDKKVKYVYNDKLKFIKKYDGNVMIDNIYCNTSLKKDSPPLWSVIKWKLSTNPQKKEKKQDIYKLPVEKDVSFADNKKDVIIWLGHNTFYIRINNITYITDPIYSDLPTSKRLIEPTYTIKELGEINYILISHAHYDHFDFPTIKSIVENNPEVEILGSLGISNLLNKKNYLKNVKYQEAGWYQRYYTKNINIDFLPAKHWHRRGAFDFNKVLWGSFGISSQKYKMYFAGDTAYNSEIFSEINEVYQGFDICFIPIGAYSPRFLMAEEHVNPEEAIDVFELIQGRYFIPMHFGTYDLTDEPLGEPIKLLNKIAKEKNISAYLLEPMIGKPFYLDTIQNKL